MGPFNISMSVLCQPLHNSLGNPSHKSLAGWTPKEEFGEDSTQGFVVFIRMC